jgi:mono/diheme cytochrome c family protein
MRAVSIFLAVIAVAVLAAGAAPPQQSYATLALVVPAGDGSAGRAVFAALSCTSCHQVAGDPGLRAPASANPGPTLAKKPAQHPGVLASAIVSPSHQVSADVAARLDGALSPMGDYTEVLTVRQLVDLVAYLGAPAEAAAALDDEAAAP